jgi:hypothetical protein
MAALRRDSRPSWVPTRRQVLVHINHSLILWYLCIAFMVFGVRVDVFQDGQTTSADVVGITVVLVILVVWLYGTWWLYRWAAKPSRPRARLHEWRQTLTALANGLEPQPSSVATFSSLITAGARPVREYPRFVALDVEFGNLTSNVGRSATRHYIAVTLPGPLPHLILDATVNDGLTSDLPIGVDRSQQLSLEGNFDRWFRVYAPNAYESDALYVLTPDVMAALMDQAFNYNVEIVDNRLVFFTSSAADFTRPEPWLAAHAILHGAAARIAASAQRYRDERVPGQNVSPLISRIHAELETPSVPWVATPPRIGPDGRRLTVRNRKSGLWSVVGAVCWVTLRFLLYVVPAAFAFAGLMSVIDGR